MSNESVSVLTTVKNVRGTIEMCLDSLENQKGVECFKVVIVCAPSTDGTEEYLRFRASQNSCINLVIEDSTQSEALMRAFREGYMGSEYVAMIDGDAVADEKWLSQLLDSARQGHPVVGGPCFTPKDATLFQRLIGYDLDLRFQQMKEGPVSRLPNMNLCVESKFFSGIEFDTSLPLAYDMEFGHRLKRLGQEIWFNPKAVVWHYHRASIKGYIRQQIGGARFAAKVFRKHPSALLGDNINPLRMTIDAPLLAGLLLSTLALPFGLRFAVFSAFFAGAFLVSMASHVVELLVTFRRSEVLLCPALIIVRAECWIIGLVEDILSRTKS